MALIKGVVIQPMMPAMNANNSAIDQKSIRHAPLDANANLKA
jgi:hypothetical protein